MDASRSETYGKNVNKQWDEVNKVTVGLQVKAKVKADKADHSDKSAKSPITKS